MSSLIDQLRAARDAGTLDTFTFEEAPRYASRGRTSNPLGSGQMVSTKQSGFIPPEVAEAVMQANEEVSSGDSIGGTLAGVGVEMGVGIGLTYKLHRSARYLNWLNNAKRVATLGVVAPEPTTTVAGLVGVAATEAAIWGFSNFLGQSTRKAFGVQDAYSAGEMIASSVFGVGLVATGVDKLVFKLAPGVGAMNAWKGKELLVQGTKTFVSGAALGLAESTMRQELEHAMNGKDRNVYDYLFSAGAGGTFNSLFSMYARTGKWGRQQAAKAAEAGRLKLEAHKATLKKQLTAATKGGAGQRNSRIRKSIQEIEQAQDVIDDTLNGINKADEGLSKAEALTEPVAKVEEPTVKAEEPEVTTPKAEEEAPVSDVEEAPKVETDRDVALNALTERVENINSENFTQEQPLLELDVKKLYNEQETKRVSAIRRIQKDGNDREALQSLLDEVVFTRKLNTQVKDRIETAGGRSVQAARRDAEKYRKTYEDNPYSFRSLKEDAALAKLERTLRERLDGADTEDILNLYDDYLAIKPRLKKEGKAQDAKERKEAKRKKKKVPTEAEKAAKLKEALKKKKATLQKQLDERRKRFGDDIELEQAQDAAKKPVKEEDPEVKDLQDRIKFYNQAEAEVATVERLEAQLARLADVEGRGVISELKDVTAPKPTGPTKPSQASIIRKKITASKKRMRDKLKDIDRVNEKEAQARIFGDLENALLASMETDITSKFTKFIRGAQLARQLAFIDQLPSVMAGFPTGVGAVIKQFFRPASTFLYNLNKGAPVAWRLAAADGAGAFKMIGSLFSKDNLKAARRTFGENTSATDNLSGRLNEDMVNSALPRGEHALVAKAHANAKRQAEAVDNVTKKFTGWINRNNFWHILSLGVRGIQGVDEAFKRPLIKGRIWAESNKKAILEFPDNPIKARKRAEELYQSAWVDSDGLEVLAKSHEFYDEVNQVREELLFASNAEKWEDVYTPSVEKFARLISKTANDDGFMGNALKAIMPFVGVPLRAVWRGGRIAFSPATVAGAHWNNPYTKKIKEFKRQIEAVEDTLRTSKDLTPKAKDGFNAEIVALTERMDVAKARELKFKVEGLTDFFISASLMSAGYAHAAAGDATGSLSWMSDDQRKKTKLKPYHSHRSNYAAAMPWSFPYALMADVATYQSLRDEQEKTGQPILSKDQTLFTVIRTSFVNLVREQPLTSGIKTAEEIATGEGEVVKNAVSRMIASYVPVPAEARKIIQMLDSGGKVHDLRGASYWERLVYAAVGSGPRNRKTDLLGNDIESSKTWGTQAVMRQLPEKETIRTELDKVLATDHDQNVQQKPAYLSTGIKMTEYRNDDGITLSYAFDKRLRETVINKQTLEEAISGLLYSTKWRDKFDSEWKLSETNPNKYENEGLLDLNEKLQKYYKRTREQLQKDTLFLSDFVNKDGEYLDEVYEEHKLESKLSTGATPRSVLDVLNVD